MSDDILKSLKELGSKHEVQLNEIRNKIRILETIPKAQALNGKCFKYKNIYSFSGKRQTWAYKRIIAISGENLIVDSFQVDGNDKAEFHFNEIEYVSRFNHPSFIPVSEKEYFKQFATLLKMIQKRGYYGKKNKRTN